jgi:hypothetical protein
VPAAHLVPHSAQHEQSIDDGEGFQNEASIQAAAAALAAALLGGGGSDSRDSTQSPRAKRRKGANQQSAAEAAAAAAAALGSADSDYEVGCFVTVFVAVVFARMCPWVVYGDLASLMSAMRLLPFEQ